MTRHQKCLAGLAVFMLASLCWGQKSPGILSSAEVKPLLPHNFYFAGRLAPVQPAQAAGVRFSNGKLLIAAPLETSGYASSLPQKLQAMIITETPALIEGSELKPGAYGFGFNSGKFVVMDVGGGTVLSVPAHRDDAMRAPVPLKISEEGGNYRLYAGRDFVSIKRQ